MFLMAMLLATPMMHSTLRTLWSEWPTNPLQPASMGMCLTLQPCSQQHSMHDHFLHLKLNLCHRAPDYSSSLITVISSAPLELLHSNEQTPPIWNGVRIYVLTAWLESKGGIFTKSKTVTKNHCMMLSHVRVVPAYRSEAEIMRQFHDWGSHWKKMKNIQFLVWCQIWCESNLEMADLPHVER